MLESFPTLLRLLLLLLVLLLCFDKKLSFVELKKFSGAAFGSPKPLLSKNFGDSALMPAAVDAPNRSMFQN